VKRGIEGSGGLRKMRFPEGHAEGGAGIQESEMKSSMRKRGSKRNLFAELSEGMSALACGTIDEPKE